MHQSRQKATTRLPIKRKGTQYVAVASSSLENSVPVVIAIRDILNLARTKKEVKKMIIQRILKINGRDVEDYRESVHLFNILHAGKDYVLKLSPTRKFFLEETKDGKERLCKVIGKRMVAKNKIQINFHDGTNLLGDNKLKVGDSVYLDLSGKLKRHVSLEKGKEVFVAGGKYEGRSGKIVEVKGKKLLIKFKENSATLNPEKVFAL